MHFHDRIGEERERGAGLARLDHPDQRGGPGDAQGQDAQVPRSVILTSSSGTAKTQYRKFETNILRKGIARPQSQFPHSCVCERSIYIFPRKARLQQNKQTDQRNI